MRKHQSGRILNLRGIGSCEPGPNQASKILAADIGDYYSDDDFAEEAAIA